MDNIDFDKNWKRNVIYFLSGQNISLFGSMLVQYAITWYITLETQSGVMMTLSIVCGFLPTFFISPFAGVWADRYNRKILIVLSDSLIALATLILAFLFIAGFDSIWLLFVASGVRSFGAGIQAPAVNAVLPQLVPSDMLIKVNGTNSSLQSFIALGSPMLSGALLTVAEIEMIFLVDVATALIGISVLLLFVRVPTHKKALERQDINYFSDMKEGISYIRHHSFILTLFVFCIVFFILAAPLAFLTPLQVARSFGDDVWRLTAIEVTFSIGMIFGGILMAVWGGFKNKLHTMFLSTLTMAIFTVALGIVPNFWIYLFLMILVGFSMPMFNTPFMVMLQQKVEQDFQGRVFGVLLMISSSFMPLAMLVYGPLADMIRIEWMLIVTGLLMLVQSIVMVRCRVLLEAGK